NTSQVVSLNFSPQGQIDLSNIFRKNGNRNRRKKDNLNNSFFVFSFPYFSYLYAKTNTVDGIDSHPSFNRDSIVQRFYTFYNYHRLRLRYTYETKETIDLIPNKRGSGSFSHSYDASLFTQYKFLGGVVITANRSSSGSLEIPKTRSYQCTIATLSLSGKPVHFLGITSTLQSKHAFTETEMVSSRLQSTTNGLSLTSSLFLFRYFSIGNSLVYTVMQSGRDKPVQKLGESIGGYCTPLRQVRLEAHYSLNDTYHQGKMRDTEQFVRADFTPFSFLSSYLELRVNQTENLLNKEVT
ncbi:MAG TPA: hypothetical protein DHV62_02795, partial [Elusimicrobia bacterium]|nr:hypothetical protein [Elusimicrobiota bacterium]